MVGDTEGVQLAVLLAPVRAEALEDADATITTAGSTGVRTATSSATTNSATVTVALRLAPNTTVRYAFTSSGDAPAITMTTSNTVIETTYPLAGGATLTKNATTGDVWSYPNLHGDTVITANSTGTKTGRNLHLRPLRQPTQRNTRQPNPRHRQHLARW